VAFGSAALICLFRLINKQNGALLVLSPTIAASLLLSSREEKIREKSQFGKTINPSKPSLSKLSLSSPILTLQYLSLVLLVSLILLREQINRAPFPCNRYGRYRHAQSRYDYYTAIYIFFVQIYVFHTGHEQRRPHLQEGNQDRLPTDGNLY
jgi:hypothetical protein